MIPGSNFAARISKSDGFLTWGHVIPFWDRALMAVFGQTGPSAGCPQGFLAGPMVGSSRYDILVHVFSQHRNWLDRRHLKTLAWLMVGLLQARGLRLTTWLPSGPSRRE
jgi:hypothetical protein